MSECDNLSNTFLYNLTVNPLNEVQLEPYEMGDIISNILNDDGTSNFCKYIKRVRYQWEIISGMYSLTKTYQNPPDDLLDYSICLTCLNEYPNDKQHQFFCNNPNNIGFIDKYKDKLTGVFKERYNTLSKNKQKNEIINYYHIFYKQGKYTTNVKTTRIPNAELYIDIGRNNYILIVLYNNGKWESRKVVGIKPDKLFNIVNK